MRKLSFLALSFFAALAFTSCTKDVDVIRPLAPSNVTLNPYTVTHSEWTGIETFSWAEGLSSTIPSQEANWSIPELTMEALDAGSVVLVYAKNRDTEEVLPVPVSYVSGPTDNINDFYDTRIEAGNIFFSHTKSVDGNYEAPTDLNNVNLRYIIVSENIYVTGRTAVTDFRSMSYAEVVKTLNIPE